MRLRPTRILPTLPALALSVALIPSAQAATPPQVSPLLFGLHQTSIGDGVFPEAHPGTVRLWDTGTLWRDIAKDRSHYDFTRLDRAVTTARANRSQVLLVLGQTPRWASTKPNAWSPYGEGASAMPRSIAYWREYVTKVVRRYKGRVKVYQVWNEANVRTFWTGSQKQMAQLTDEAARIIKRYDRTATVVSPSFGTRLRTNIPDLSAFLKAGGARHVDAVALHLYPLPSGGPEGSMTLLAKARAALKAAKVDKPIWDTEINYGAGVGGAAPRHYSGSASASYVARTYLLHAANGVSRAYWYGWDASGVLGITLTRNGLVTEAGTAYVTVQKWMVGSRVYGCSQDRLGTYTCTLRFPGSWGRVMWNPHRAFGVRAPAGTVSVSSLDGTYRSARRGSRVQVSSLPVMIRSTRR